jgi:hypothetical protein
MDDGAELHGLLLVRHLMVLGLSAEVGRPLLPFHCQLGRRLGLALAVLCPDEYSAIVLAGICPRDSKCVDATGLYSHLHVLLARLHLFAVDHPFDGQRRVT